MRALSSSPGRWGGPPGPRPTPSSASFALEKPDQGSGADEGVRPTILWGLLFILIAVPLTGQTLDECRGLRHHGKLAEAQTCYAKLAESSNPYLRAEGLWGIERYDDANAQFRDLIKQFPKNADYRVRWGHLFLERFNNEEANGLFNEALKIDPNNAQAYLGLAQVEAEGLQPGGRKIRAEGRRSGSEALPGA